MQSLLDEKKKAWKEKRKEKKEVQNSGGNANQGGGRGGNHGSGRGGHGGGHGGHDGLDCPAQGRDNNHNGEDEDEDEEEEAGKYHEASNVLCIHGGASTLSSHREFKQLSREVNAVQPTVEAQQPLKWSHDMITFDAEDHVDCKSGVGILPLVVPPTINNIKVTNMLIDGGAGLNLLPTKVYKKMQIPMKHFCPMGMFQIINPGAT